MGYAGQVGVPSKSPWQAGEKQDGGTEIACRPFDSLRFAQDKGRKETYGTVLMCSPNQVLCPPNSLPVAALRDVMRIFGYDHPCEPCHAPNLLAAPKAVTEKNRIVSPEFPCPPNSHKHRVHCSLVQARSWGLATGTGDGP